VPNQPLLIKEWRAAVELLCQVNAQPAMRIEMSSAVLLPFSVRRKFDFRLTSSVWLRASGSVVPECASR
jgi:hypothetical protein